MTEMGGQNIYFQATHWSVVKHALAPDTPEAIEALERLIESYWKPVYFFIRRKGYSFEEAKDLTQGFFCRLLDRGGLEGYDRDRGRFRTYLLGAVQFFLKQQRSRAAALKRGGGRQRFALDCAKAEAAYASEIADDDTPELLYERAWAQEVLQCALQEVQAELQSEGKDIYFQVLNEHLRPEAPSYSEIGSQLDLSVTDVTNYLHRARKRLRQAFLRKVLPSVSQPEEAEKEIAELLAALNR